MRRILLNKQTKGLRYTVYLFCVLIIVGTYGYMLIEDISFIDGLYMTIITVTTVGFSEVTELSPTGRVFTILLILFSVGLIGVMLNNFSRLMMDGYFRAQIRDFNLRKKMMKLSNHVIVCGYGRNGFQACEELADHRIPFIVVEKRDHVVERLREIPERLYIQGDASSEEVLGQANIQNAKALITALPNDADNIYVVLTAREMNPNLKIISRASAFQSDVKLRRAGADNVIMPDRIGGQRMAKLVAQSDVLEFWEYILLQKSQDVSLENISCDCIPERSGNLKITLSGLKLREKTGANIIGVKRENGQYIYNPSPDFILSRADDLFVLGSPLQLENLKALLSSQQ